MLTRLAKPAFALFFALIGLQAGQASAEPLWEPVPLTGEAQYRAGIAGGEGFQYVHALVYAPGNPEIAYMSTDTSGIWRSDDGGRHWKPAMHDFIPYGARSLAVDPLNPEILLAAGFLGVNKEEAIRYKGRVQGIFKSVDGSLRWTGEAVLPGGVYKQASKGELILYVPRPGDEKYTSLVYAAVEDGLYYSERGGERGTWRGPLSFPGGVRPEILDIERKYGGSGAELFIATNLGLFVSKNNEIQKTGRGLDDWPRSIAASGDDPALILAAAGDRGLYVSRDGGVSFQKAKAPALPYSDVAISPVNSNIQYARADQSGKPPVYSHDGGLSWHYPKTTNKGGLVDHEGFWFSSPFAPHPTNALEALHVSNGRARILRTEDGGATWEYSGSGFMGGRMVDMIFNANADPLLCLTDHGLWQLKQNGVAVRVPLPSPSGSSSVDACSGDRDMYTLTVGGWNDRFIAYGEKDKFQTGDDIRINWRFLPERYRSYGYSYTQKAPVALRVVENMLQSGTPAVWRKLPHKVFHVIGGKAPVFYALHPGDESSRAYVVKSLDLGETWVRVSPPLPSAAGSVHFATLSLARGGERVHLGTSNGVWTYSGGVWRQAAAAQGLPPDGLGGVHVFYIAVGPKDPDTLYAARRGLGYGRVRGVYRSSDGGASWRDFSYNFPTEAVFSIQINPYNGDVYLGSSIGTYRMSAESAARP